MVISGTVEETEIMTRHLDDNNEGVVEGKTPRHRHSSMPLIGKNSNFPSQRIKRQSFRNEKLFERT